MDESISTTVDVITVRLSKPEIAHLIDVLSNLTHTVRWGEHTEERIESTILKVLQRALQ